MPEAVPFLDLRTPHRELSAEILAAWKGILESAAFVGGAEVEAFEEEFAAYVGARYCVGMNSGTDALRLALQAAGIGPGDEVITVAHTFIATTEAISQVGARPVFVDVEPRSATLDPDRLESAITPKTRAVVPVHLYGQPADMDAIQEIAARRGLLVIHDAAQAHGARYRDQPLGALGHSAAYSFYPGKNLGACGEAGAVVTNDLALTQQLRMLRDHGQARKYHHDIEGWNARLDALQAAALRIKLRRLDDWNDRRRSAARAYRERLAGTGLELPEELEGRTHVYHLYVVRHRERDRIQKYLGDNGVAAALHYPIPLHLQKAYREMGHPTGTFPHAERWASHCLSLPMFPELTISQIDRVAELLKSPRAGLR